MPALSELAKARRKLILKWRRFLGLCVGCGGETIKRQASCAKCQDRMTEAIRQRRLKSKQSGMCQECGKNKANSDGYRCDRCIDLMRLRKEKRICSSDGCHNDAVFRRSMCQDCIDLKESEKHSCKVYFINCLGCNKLFTSKRSRNMYCSYDCRRESYMVKKIRRQCSVCGKIYELKQGKNFDNTCSVECRKVVERKYRRKSDYRRRQKIRSTYVEYVSIPKLFKRDGGRCQICGRKLNLKRQVPHPLAATRDHIIPASKGGETSYKNMQLACFACNSLKGDRPVNGGDQLLLFGDA